MDDFITYFFSDLISGHQLSLEQVAGCHKEICQNSDKCINVKVSKSLYDKTQGPCVALPLLGPKYREFSCM